MRVVAQVPKGVLSPIAERFPEVEFLELRPDSAVAADLSGDVLVTWRGGAEQLPELLRRNIPWVHVLGTGVDDFPLHLLGGRVLTCARGVAGGPISEWVLAVMLAFEKQLPEQWISEPPEEMMAASLGTLQGRSLGLVGLGSIGCQVARHSLGFGMHVRAVRRRPQPSPIEGVDVMDRLEDLLPWADHVVVVAPATPATKGLLGERAFSLMKDGAHLVNVARGTLVDQEALKAALDSGRLARASLDTTSPEPLPPGHWMYKHAGIRLSPHVSWSAPGALETALERFAANLQRHLAGEPLHGVVDPVEGY